MGSEMCIRDRCQNECRDASREARQIAEGLIHTEEDFMGRMKEFL